MDAYTKIHQELTDAGFDHALAIATQAEIKAGAACGQLSLLTEIKQNEEKG